MYKNLSNGVKIPNIGLGLWQIQLGDARQAILYGLEAGYRHIDTAKIYGNESDVGEAVLSSNIPREEIFITTKLWNEDQGYDKTLDAFENSLRTMGLDYVDLYLIHWPVSPLRRESWRALESIYKNGRVKAIGVSNYTIAHLEEMKHYVSVMPMVNQVEFHPYLYQKSLLEYCTDQNILLEGYSPLVRGEKMSDPVLQEIGNKYGKSPAQILIRWSIQHGVVPLPKSINQHRIRENINIYDFEINIEDMQRLDNLNQDYRTCWDPSDIK